MEDLGINGDNNQVDFTGMGLKVLIEFMWLKIGISGRIL
jgi:hypothetical protein